MILDSSAVMAVLENEESAPQGSTREEALTGIREAIALYVESLEAHGEPVPPPITEEIVEI